MAIVVAAVGHFVVLALQAVFTADFVRGKGIVSPVGDATLIPSEEKELRLRVVQQALDALSREAG